MSRRIVTLPAQGKNMLNKSALVPAGLIKPDMEIITADGRRVGYVADVASGEIISHTPARRIPLSRIRRIDDDVHISRRLHQLDLIIRGFADE